MYSSTAVYAGGTSHQMQQRLPSHSQGKEPGREVGNVMSMSSSTSRTEQPHRNYDRMDAVTIGEGVSKPKVTRMDGMDCATDGAGTTRCFPNGYPRKVD